MSTDKSLKQLKSKDKFLIANVPTISRNTQGGTAHDFRQLGSAEEPFSEYVLVGNTNEKPVHFRHRNVLNGDNTNLWATLTRLL